MLHTYTAGALLVQGLKFFFFTKLVVRTTRKFAATRTHQRSQLEGDRPSSEGLIFNLGEGELLISWVR